MQGTAVEVPPGGGADSPRRKAHPFFTDRRKWRKVGNRRRPPVGLVFVIGSGVDTRVSVLLDGQLCLPFVDQDSLSLRFEKGGKR